MLEAPDPIPVEQAVGLTMQITDIATGNPVDGIVWADGAPLRAASTPLKATFHASYLRQWHVDPVTKCPNGYGWA